MTKESLCKFLKIMETCEYSYVSVERDMRFCSHPKNDFDGLCSCEACEIPEVKKEFYECYEIEMLKHYEENKREKM